jgi:dolichol-phosphate mannosyltransferase
MTFSAATTRSRCEIECLKLSPDLLNCPLDLANQNSCKTKERYDKCHPTEIQIVIPTLNEIEGIGSTIREIRLFFKPEEAQILVIDGGSEDGTIEKAINLGARVVIDTYPGKGSAFQRALKEVTSPFIFMVDGDFTYDISCLPKMLEVLKFSPTSVVVGIRTHKGTTAMTPLHKIGNWGLSAVATVLYQTYMPDVCSGLWGFTLKNLRGFSITSKGFTLEADLFNNVYRRKLSIYTLPVNYRPRPGASQPKLKTVMGFEIFRFLVERRFSKWVI